MTSTAIAGTQGVFQRTDDLAEAGHEQVVYCHDADTGLRAIIAIHNTTLGPGLGGTRFRNYATEQEALLDALRLSQGMTFKNAAAGLPLGGGKAVIIGDPNRVKTPELLRAYGRFVEGLGGRYVTAADVGTSADDLDIVGETTQYVVGRTTAAGGRGDSAPATAAGVFLAMQVAAERIWGSEGVAGRTVGVEGAGKVGTHLVRLLLEAGATVIISDVDSSARERLRGKGVQTAERLDGVRLDVYAPCALGATVSVERATALGARLVCGAANNQLHGIDQDARLADAGVLWVPDFIANAGGVVHVGSEYLNRSPEQVDTDLHRIARTTTEVLDQASATGVPTGVAANQIVSARLAKEPEHV